MNTRYFPPWSMIIMHFALMHEIVIAYENCPDIRSVWHLHVFVPTAVWASRLLLGYWKHDNFAYYSERPLLTRICAVHFVLVQFDIMFCCSHVWYHVYPWVLHIILFTVMWLILVDKEYRAACDETDLMKVALANTEHAMRDLFKEAAEKAVIPLRDIKAFLFNSVKKELAEVEKEIRSVEIRLTKLINVS